MVVEGVDSADQVQTLLYLLEKRWAKHDKRQTAAGLKDTEKPLALAHGLKKVIEIRYSEHKGDEIRKEKFNECNSKNHKKHL